MGRRQAAEISRSVGGIGQGAEIGAEDWIAGTGWRTESRAADQTGSTGWQQKAEQPILKVQA